MSLGGLWRLALGLLVLGGSTACSSVLTVRGDVVLPARIPVRAFPRILVTGDGSRESTQLARAVADHLAGGRSEVRIVDESEVEALRRRREIARATVVIRVVLTMRRREQPEWGRRDTASCGPLGCPDTRRAQVRDVPVVTGNLVLSVAEGPNGRALQREELTEEETGMDELGARLRVVERLRTRAVALLDQRSEQVAVELVPAEHPDVRRALLEIGRGRWRTGRLLLQRAVAAPHFDRLPVEQRAIVRFDLGQALRFDTSLPIEDRFALSSAALSAAIRLRPEERFARALAALGEQRRSRAMVAAQQDAMAHNFGLEARIEQREQDAHADIPDPPVSYLRRASISIP